MKSRMGRGPPGDSLPRLMMSFSLNSGLGGKLNGVLSLLEVFLLPSRPDSVDLGMVQEENRITRAGELVALVVTDT